MIHLDIKKLGKFNQVGHRITGDRTGQSNSRGVGWEFLHVCIDDASRVAFSKIMKTERGRCAVAFLKAAVAYYKSLGITVLRVMTDNGSCYRSRAFAKACRRLKLKHIRTKPYTPRTNGKAERFIQTSLREWAYARAYLNSKQRAHELPFFMHRYNWHRPHASIGAKPPITRLGLTEDNLLRLHTTKFPSQAECCSMTGPLGPGGPTHLIALPPRLWQPAGRPYARNGQLHRVAVMDDEQTCFLGNLQGPLDLVTVRNPSSVRAVADPPPRQHLVLGVLIESDGDPHGQAVVHLCL